VNKFVQNLGQFSEIAVALQLPVSLMCPWPKPNNQHEAGSKQLRLYLYLCKHSVDPDHPDGTITLTSDPDGTIILTSVDFHWTTRRCILKDIELFIVTTVGTLILKKLRI
jgi:hypothetical protein